MGCECGKFVLAEVEWSVPTLNGEGCAEKLRETLEEITAVRGVRVRMRERTVLIGFDADHTGLQQLKDALNRAGFSVALGREEMCRTEIFGSGEHVASITK